MQHLPHLWIHHAIEPLDWRSNCFCTCRHPTRPRKRTVRYRSCGENQMSKNSDRKQAGHILWNAAIVVALLASVVLFINNRQLAGTLAQLNQHNQDQIAKLQEELSQTGTAARESVDALARQAQETAAQAEARAKQDVHKTSANLSAKKREKKKKKKKKKGEGE